MPRILIAAVLLLAWCTCELAAQGGGVWLDLPFVKQQKDGCGAASISMIVQYWRQQQHAPPMPDADSAAIYRALYSKPDRGIRSSEMVRYFQQHGFRAFAYAGDWADLNQQLAKGRPLIAALKPGPGSSLHYLVVAGVDPEQNLVLLNDPAQRKLLKEKKSRFEQEWKSTGYWTLLALPEAPSR